MLWKCVRKPRRGFGKFSKSEVLGEFHCLIPVKFCTISISFVAFINYYTAKCQLTHHYSDNIRITALVLYMASCSSYLPCLDYLVLNALPSSCFCLHKKKQTEPSPLLTSKLIQRGKTKTTKSQNQNGIN